MRNLLIAIFACGALLQAGLTVPAGPWQSLSTTNNGSIMTGLGTSTTTAYWNNASNGDGAGCRNVGCFVTATGAYTGGTVHADVFLANADGTAANSGEPNKGFYFSGTVTTPNPTILAEVAGNKDYNWIGWYDKSKATLAAGDWGVIFDGSKNVGANATFTPTAEFGLWFLPKSATDGFGTNIYSAALDSSIQAKLNSGDSIFSEYARNKGFDNTKQYFSLFAKAADLVSPPTDFVVGVEDLKNFDNDYNDMVIKLTLVPEPGFYGALALGLAGVYMAVRRKKA